jgi:queuosine precursor transporter
MFSHHDHLKVTNGDQGWHPKHFDVVACLYIGALFLTWVTAGKLFAFGGLVLSASALVYPLNCIFGDVLTEIYGFNRTRRLIWMGFICGLMFLLATQIAIALPPAAVYTAQEAFATINGAMPRIVIASYAAYLCCEFTNSSIMSKMKVAQNAKLFPVRAIASTLAAQLVDSAVFFAIAFGGTMPLSALLLAIVSSWLFKTFYETAALPVTTLVVNKLKALEGVEQFDRYTLRVFKF